ncbi:MAG TPA: hypothetical protein VGG48_13265 [Rhizomicrobium sp.]
MTQEQKNEIFGAMEANRARQEAVMRKQQFDAGEFSLDLVSAPDDPPEHDERFQKELSQFGKALSDGNVPYSQRAIAFDAVDAHGYPLPEFVLALKVLAAPAIAAVAGAVGAWIQARYGRKARLKIGDIEAEARTPAEVEELLKMAAKYDGREHKKRE